MVVVEINEMGSSASIAGPIATATWAADDSALVDVIARELEQNPERVAELLAIAQRKSGVTLVPAKAGGVTPAAATTEAPAAAAVDAVLDELVVEINSARTDPQGYCAKLREILLQFDTDGRTRLVPELKTPGTPRSPGRRLLTVEGVSAVNDCIAEMERLQPVPPISIPRVPGLSLAADSHAKDLGMCGSTGHVGSDGSTMAERVAQHGQWIGHVGENISYGCADAAGIVTQLLIDDGVASRGHRHNLLKDSFRVVGLGLRPHKTYAWCCVLDFADGFKEGPRPQLEARTTVAVCDGSAALPAEVLEVLAAIALEQISDAVEAALIGPNARVGARVDIDFSPPVGKEQGAVKVTIDQPDGAQTTLASKLF